MSQWSHEADMKTPRCLCAVLRKQLIRMVVSAQGPIDHRSHQLPS